MNSETAIEVIRYLGMIFCVFLSILLFRSRTNRGNSYLAVLLLMIGANVLYLGNLQEDFVRKFPEFIILVDWLPFAYAPLLYLYIRSSYGYSRSSFSAQAVHFASVGINTVYLVVLYAVLGRQGFASMAIGILGGNLTWFFFVSMAIKIGLALGYLIAAVKFLLTNKELFRISTANRYRRNWFVSAIICFVLLYLSPPLGLALQLGTLYEILSLCLMTLWAIVAVYFALHSPEIFQDPRLTGLMRRQFYNSEYERNIIRTRIQHQFEKQRLHLNPELKLSDLASALKVSANRTSFYINDIFGRNFNELVNDFRLTQFLFLAEADEDATSTILEMALNSGFNSKSSFNRAFKSSYGRTPSQYLRGK